MASPLSSQITPADNLSRAGSFYARLGDDIPRGGSSDLVDPCFVPDIRVVVAGPKDSVRNELCFLLAAEVGVRITAECPEDGIPVAIKEHDPDVLVFNCETRDPRTLRFLRAFAAPPPSVFLFPPQKKIGEPSFHGNRGRPFEEPPRRGRL